MTFRQVGQAETLQGSLEQGARAIENQLALYTYVYFAAVPLELPRIQSSAMGRQEKIYAILLRQVLLSAGRRDNLE